MDISCTVGTIEANKHNNWLRKRGGVSGGTGACPRRPSVSML